MKRFIPTLPSLLLSLLISGCTMAPDYTRPELEIPTEFNEIKNDPISWRVANPGEFTIGRSWWQEFNDPILNSLIARLDDHNNDLIAYRYRIDQARSFSNIQFSNLFPKLDLASSASRYQASENSPLLSAAPTSQNIFSDIRATFDLTYELDLWGRVKNEYNAADYNLHSLEADFQSVLLMTQVELVKTYFQLKLLEKFKEINTASIKLNQENYTYIEHQYQQGMVDEITLKEQEKALLDSENALANLEIDLVKTNSALAILVGENPSTFTTDVSDTTTLPKIPVYLPSTLLERRPDIASAERKMMQSNEEIGAARAAFFPSINLIGSSGYESTLTNRLFNSNSKLWSLGANIDMPIFNVGGTYANLTRAEAKYLEDVANYKKQVLIAFSDVENSLASLKAKLTTEENIRKDLKNRLKATHHLIHKYKQGLISHHELNKAKIALLHSQALAYAEQNALILSNLQLIKALGGGYVDDKSIPDKEE